MFPRAVVCLLALGITIYFFGPLTVKVTKREHQKYLWNVIVLQVNSQ